MTGGSNRSESSTSLRRSMISMSLPVMEALRADSGLDVQRPGGHRPPLDSRGPRRPPGPLLRLVIPLDPPTRTPTRRGTPIRRGYGGGSASVADAPTPPATPAHAERDRHGVATACVPAGAKARRIAA